MITQQSQITHLWFKCIQIRQLILIAYLVGTRQLIRGKLKSCLINEEASKDYTYTLYNTTVSTMQKALNSINLNTTRGHYTAIFKC